MLRAEAVARVIRVAVEDLAEGERTLPEAASRYLVRVHRVGEGAPFVAFDPSVRVEADATVLDAHKQRVRCRVGPLRPASALASAKVTLLWGLGKGDKIDHVIRDATALGVERLVVVSTERSVPRLGERARERSDRWQQIALDAARQSGRGDVPELSPPAALEQALAETGAPRRIVLVPEAELALAQALADWHPGEPLAALIGPEGGLTQEEIEQAVAAGFVPVRFGPFVLRTETAATALLGALLAFAEPRR